MQWLSYLVYLMVYCDYIDFQVTWTMHKHTGWFHQSDRMVYFDFRGNVAWRQMEVMQQGCLWLGLVLLHETEEQETPTENSERYV